MKILIFNSNEKSRLVVGQLMKELSFSVSLAEDKNKMMQELKSDTIDIVMLDVKSFKNTFSKELEEIIDNKKNSYILLSIEKDDRYSKTEALLQGIDDYVYNDYKLDELSAKVDKIDELSNKVDNLGKELKDFKKEVYQLFEKNTREIATVINQLSESISTKNHRNSEETKQRLEKNDKEHRIYEAQIAKLQLTTQYLEEKGKKLA